MRCGRTASYVSPSSSSFKSQPQPREYEVPWRPRYWSIRRSRLRPRFRGQLGGNGQQFHAFVRFGWDPRLGCRWNTETEDSRDDIALYTRLRCGSEFVKAARVEPMDEEESRVLKKPNSTLRKCDNSQSRVTRRSGSGIACRPGTATIFIFSC